ncbi:MAG: DUF5666 domain-containing protein [Candidatus Acidiferrales bacterium]
MASIKKTRARALFLALCFLNLCLAISARSDPWQQQSNGSSGPAKPIGAIKALNGNSITLASDAGPIFMVVVQDNARLVRIEPGAKDLKNAVAVQLRDLQVGDRILVLGQISEDGRSVAASSVIVMKKADVESKQEHDRQDWFRHGVGGLVSSVDPSTGTITISTVSLNSSKTIAVHTSAATVVRRYAPDSVKFDDAKLSSLDQIKPGDQLRARGTPSADGNDIAADEVVSGSFRNIEGTISSIDAASGTLSVMDLMTKKTVLVKVTAESQLRKLPPVMAQFMAMRLKNAPSEGGSSTAEKVAGQSQASDSSANKEARPAGDTARGGRGGAGGSGDLSQMLSRVPHVTLADMQKGEAVMIVSTEGNPGEAVTAITLVAGVEPILEASPSGSQSMILPPWTFDAPAADTAQ